MALVYELTEVIDGDTPSFHLTREELIEKKRRDAVAMQELMAEYSDCPQLMKNMMEYENKQTPESRLVYWVDKSMPAFSYYHACQREHFFAPIDEICEIDDYAWPGREFCKTNVGQWYERTCEKLLAAGDPPHSICERILEQNLLWLEWMIDAHEQEIF